MVSFSLLAHSLKVVERRNTSCAALAADKSHGTWRMSEDWLIATHSIWYSIYVLVRGEAQHVALPIHITVLSIIHLRLGSHLPPLAILPRMHRRNPSTHGSQTLTQGHPVQRLPKLVLKYKGLYGVSESTRRA